MNTTEATETKKSQAAMEAKKLTIIIVDLDATNQFLYSTVLKNYCEKIYQAKTGEEAKRIISSLANEEKSIDLALVHQRLDGISGKNICQLIRDKNPKARIIAMNSYLGYNATNAEYEGFDDYLSIPSTIDDILRVIFK